MANWREANPSNVPGTCLWCGLRLADYVRHRWDQETHQSIEVTRFKNAGNYGDGFFCGLRCGYMFGEQMAKFYHRLSPPTKVE